MGSFELMLSGDGWAEFAAIPFPFRRHINQRLAKLRADPRPVEAQWLTDDVYRLVSHGWAILYEINDKVRLIEISSFRRAK